jgi:hypothetical protein
MFSGRQGQQIISAGCSPSRLLINEPQQSLGVRKIYYMDGAAFTAQAIDKKLRGASGERTPSAATDTDRRSHSTRVLQRVYVAQIREAS